MSLPRRILRAAQWLVPRGGGLTVLAYHLVGAGTESAVDLPVSLFRDHLDELEATAEVVPLGAGVAALHRGEGDSGNRPRVALTFDDAYRNFADIAWPLLAARKMPATLFVPVGFVAGECPPPNSMAPLPAASWSTLANLVHDGLDIGSHTWSHPDLTRLDDAALDRELVGSRRELEDRLSMPVPAFCYPRALWSPRLEGRVARSYDLAVIGGGGRNLPGRVDPLRLERVSLRRDGPRQLEPVLTSRLWLEERVADRVRRWRR